MENRIIYIIVSSLLFSIIFSCSDKQEMIIIENEETYLQLSGIIENCSPKTKAAIKTASFSDDANIGLVIYNNNTTTEYISGYENIRANLLDSVNNNWGFFLNENNTSMQNLLLFRNGPLYDIYAYHPYQMGVTDVENIPFNVNGEAKDYMYATPLTAQVSPSVGNKSITLNFKHIMTCLTFRIKTVGESASSVSSIRISNFKPYIRNTSNGKKQYQESIETEFKLKGSGSYNAKNGNFVELNNVENIQVFYKNGNISQNYRDFHLIMPGIIHDDESNGKKKFKYYEYKLEFFLDNKEIEYPGNEPIYLSTENYYTGSQDNYGFMTGYEYIHTLEINDFIKFNGTPIIREWGIGDDINIDL